ncbi:Undecaprenyl-phosphate galactosephosphotransferase [hydrothermal vent metagenome]|uniref:Undecaprenyl-phosphate galactosephosphotransferase n=1 Tax=hydrothermal vent metagenome TaxID=652676 RepID=A0A3B0ZBZ5_9ZZZZ
MRSFSANNFRQSRHSKLSLFTRVTDVLWVVFIFWLLALFYDVEFDDRLSLVVACGAGIFVFLAETNDLYRSWRGAPLWQEGIRLWWVWLGVVLGLLLLAYVTKSSAEYSRRVVVSWFVLTPLLLTIWRSYLHLMVGYFRRYGFNNRSVAIVGARAIGVKLAQTIENAPWMGLDPIGFYDDRNPNSERIVSGTSLQVLGTLEDLVIAAKKGEIDQVYITLPMEAEKRIRLLISKLSDTTVSVHMLPDFFTFDLMNASWSHVGDLPTITIKETPYSGVDSWIKRLEDIVLSMLILIAIAVPMLIIAFAVKKSSPGPIIFRQFRYGLQGERIEVWKFRSMRVDEVKTDNVVQAIREDPRVTRLGGFLRRTSLDELPQFINVLQGRMSIVGPRPHAVEHNEFYRSEINEYMLRHKVRPGITGWAQVNGWRGETDTVEKMRIRVEHDLAYIRNWSLWLDLRIIFVTILKGFSGKNAY